MRQFSSSFRLETRPELNHELDKILSVASKIHVKRQSATSPYFKYETHRIFTALTFRKALEAMGIKDHPQNK